MVSRLSSDPEYRQLAISKGLGILTFKSLKWRNCPTTIRMEHVIRVYLGLVKYTHPISSVETPFAFGNHFCREKSTEKMLRFIVNGLYSTTKKLVSMYELAAHGNLLMRLSI